MLDYQIALEQLLHSLQGRQTKITETPLIEAVGRRLAQNIPAKYDSPLFDNSAMDGYALCIDEHNASSNFQLIGRIAAGDTADKFILEQGQAVRIFTGAPVPKGANAVIPQEQAECFSNTLHCLSNIQPSQHIRYQGEDIRVNDRLLSVGHLLTPAAIGLAASQGYAVLPTHSSIRVTVFSSGNELSEPTQTPISAGSIFDANRYQLLAWLQKLGCEVHDGGILPDDREITEMRLYEAAHISDLILTSGGVSVGEEDHLKASLESIGELHQWRLLIKPGKPFAWGRINTASNQTTIMMLPGNPVATFVTFKMLVEPALRFMTGSSLLDAKPTFMSAQVEFEYTKPDTRREFLRGIIHHDDQGVAHVTKLSNQGSHMLTACAIANVLIEVPPDTSLKQGDIVKVYQL